MFDFLPGQLLSIKWGSGHSCQAVISAKGNTQSEPVVKMPVFKGGFLCLPPEEPLYITYIFDDKMFTFLSKLKQLSISAADNIPLLHLQPPRSISAVENPRSNQRIFADLPVRIYKENQIYFGITVDISAGGLLLKSKADLRAGEDMSLEISLGKSGVITSAARVVRKDSYESTFHYGMNFVQIDNHQLHILESYLAAALESLGVSCDFEDHELEQIQMLLSYAG